MSSAFLFAGLLAASACDNSLSRAKAAEMICKAESLPKPIYFDLGVGRFHEGSVSMFGPRWGEYLAAWTSLESMGFVVVKRLGKIGGGGLLNIPWDTVEVSLIDKGRTTFTHDKDNFWKIEICRKTLVEVTGIAMDSAGTTATVEYTWRYDGVSPAANAVLPISDLRGTNLSQLYKDQVAMRQYDDGWRIVR